MHFDWANARGESLERTEAMGREIERMDQDMRDIEVEIEQLDRHRHDLAALPLQSIKRHQF